MPLDYQLSAVSCWVGEHFKVNCNAAIGPKMGFETIFKEVYDGSWFRW